MANHFFEIKLKEEELKNQIDNYNTLSVGSSYRKVSAMLFLLSAAITVTLILLQMSDVNAFIDVVLLLFLAYFVYQGQKWAIIAAMILWTFEKVYSLSGGQYIVTQIVWWLIYITTFYKALQVEEARGKVAVAAAIPPPPPVAS